MTTSDLDPRLQRARFVANWLSHRFAESRWWTADEIDLAARNAGIVLGQWFNSPPCKALGIRSVSLKREWDGAPTWFYTTELESMTPKEETKSHA